MSDNDVRNAVLELLRDGPLLTTQLIDSVAAKSLEVGPAGDAVKAAVWDLVEQRKALWDEQGRVYLVEEALAARR